MRVFAGKRLTISMAVFLALTAPTGAAAREKWSVTPEYLLIFDFRQVADAPVTRSSVVSPIGFSMASIDRGGVACSEVEGMKVAPLNKLKAIALCAIDRSSAGATAGETTKNRSAAAALIAASLDELRPKASTRAITGDPSSALVIVLQTVTIRSIHTTQTCTGGGGGVDSAVHEIVMGRQPRFTISEIERKSRIATDAAAFIAVVEKAVAAAPGPGIQTRQSECRPAGAHTVVGEGEPRASAWASGIEIPLLVRRATVTIGATLPASVRRPLTASDPDLASALVAKANDLRRVESELRQEQDDKKLFHLCPPDKPGRLDVLQQAVCALAADGSGSTATSLAAVDALSNMATPRRATFLRWALESKTGETRERALVALAKIPSAELPTEVYVEVGQKAELLSGPREHWSIAADMLVNLRMVLAGESAGNRSPQEFYVSLNWLSGDWASDRRNLLQNIEVKGLVKGTTSPLDSVGVGIGVRGRLSRWCECDGLKFLDAVNFDVVSPFVAWTWAKQDNGEWAPRERRFGVSLHVNKALGWVK